MSERSIKKSLHGWYKPRPVIAKLKIFEQNWPRPSYDWEMRTERVYLTSEHDDGYTTNANAKRAAKKVAEQFGITIKTTEDES